MQKRPTWIKIVASDFLSIWIMAIVSTCCGFAINQFRNNPLPLVYSPKSERIQQAVAKLSVETPPVIHPSPRTNEASVSQTDPPGLHSLDLAAFREIVERKTKGITLDARPEIFYQLGHVPGAISLPREEFEVSYGKQRSFLENDKSLPIAVYCSDSDCEDSQMVADALVKLGFAHVYAFKGGWSDWTSAHLPEEKDQ